MILANTVSINLVDPIVEATGAEWMIGTNLWGILLRLLMAFVFAAVLGIERSIKRHTAGLRTYILVCVASTVVMLVNEYLVAAYGTGDVARLGAQVIPGIGFLGAGTILVTSRNQVKGLTTAAGLWASACLGLCIGAGFYTVAITGFILVTFTIFFMPSFEKFFTKKVERLKFILNLKREQI
jgi:putative Mg2+ transporter-C (MgtC) family protein